MAHKRKSIPTEIKLKLWVKSGGRCEFPGCNKEAWRDELTMQEDNFAHVAHIVAASPDGPRGDEVLSEELDVDFENLLLLCQIHSKLIDGAHKSDYSVEQLKQYKREHEERIQLQTSLGPDLKTTVVRFESPIGERRVPVAIAQTYEALDNRYPGDDKGIFFNFSSKAGSGDKSFWSEYAREISDQVRHAFRTSNNEMRYDHLSIFALAPIPALVCFGNQVGNVVPTDLFQKHRDTDDWKWKADADQFEFIYHKPSDDGSSKKVALVLSLSGTVKSESYTSVVGEVPVYEITIPNPNPGFLNQKESVVKFKKIYRQVLSEIQALHGSQSEIHLFPAIPAPIAVACGQALLPKADPYLIVYDFDHAHKGFIETLTINKYD